MAAPAHPPMSIEAHRIANGILALIHEASLSDAVGWLDRQEDGPGLSDDTVAMVLVWSHTTVGHEICEQIGEDPDLWAYPSPPILAALEDRLYLLLPPGSASLSSSSAFLGDISVSVAPSLLLLDAVGIRNHAHEVRALLRDVFVTSTATAWVQSLTEHGMNGFRVSLNAEDSLTIHASALDDIVQELRTVVEMTWVDKEQGWTVSHDDTDRALQMLRRRAVAVPEEVALRLQRTGSPLLSTGPGSLQETSMTQLRGFGTQKCAAFSKVGINNLYDLLLFAPRRYMDRSNITPIAATTVGEDCAVVGVIDAITPNPAKRMVRFNISDGSSSLTAVFFNSIWMAKRYSPGDHVILLGKMEEWRGRTRLQRQMTNPIMESFHNETIPVIPIYPQSATHRVSTWEIRRAVELAFARLSEEVADPLPDSLLDEYSLPTRDSALRDLHFPDSLENAQAARRRLAFDELLRLQLALLRAKKQIDEEHGVQQAPTGILTDKVLASLPFSLTAAQATAWAEIVADVSSSSPMHRLVQGDVGSGKTLVALLALLCTVEGGNQAAFMAPTEILATQLFEEISSRLRAAGLQGEVSISLLTSKVRPSQRRAILRGLADGEIDIVVGTHSLISETVQFARLGLVVIDEQHRFGVEQRASLRAKVASEFVPDMLVMTATPIPRTAAITAFGDLDVTVIGELPPGRTPIETVWVNHDVALSDPSALPWSDVISELRADRQAFIVCPLVEGSEKMQAASAEETFQSLVTGAFKDWSVRLVHGQQSHEERAAAMEAFIAGEADVLVSTTVIEVGVNIPNASRMVILNAERFGIAQLHQLRGRVGRGTAASRCYLVGSPSTPDGQARLQALCDSSDGFYLSEIDLSLRGPGNLLGSEQSGGISDLRVADLMRDRDLLVLAREAATQIIDADPLLHRYPGLRAELAALVGAEHAQWLFKS